MTDLDEDSDDRGPAAQSDASMPPPQVGIEAYIRQNPTMAVFAALLFGIVVGRLGIL